MLVAPRVIQKLYIMRCFANFESKSNMFLLRRGSMYVDFTDALECLKKKDVHLLQRWASSEESKVVQVV